MRKAFKDKRAVKYGIDGYATDLVFADESAILSKMDTEVTNTLYDIARFAEPFGLKINNDKTKVLTTNGSLANVNFEEIKIKQVQVLRIPGPGEEVHSSCRSSVSNR